MSDRRQPPLAREHSNGRRVLTAFDAPRFWSALPLAGFSSANQLRLALNLSQSRIKQITSGMLPPDGLRQRIAAALNVNAVDLWPDCTPVEVR